MKTVGIKFQFVTLIYEIFYRMGNVSKWLFDCIQQRHSDLRVYVQCTMCTQQIMRRPLTQVMGGIYTLSSGLVIPDWTEHHQDHSVSRDVTGLVLRERIKLFGVRGRTLIVGDFSYRQQPTPVSYLSNHWYLLRSSYKAVISYMYLYVYVFYKLNDILLQFT